ncbi:hypothetical protein [Pelomonas sp. Root1444]|uniref:hypothetical protein n=1 Tax=Pelomonas sp. Root1444 TaxID=1736464 RepID=UPI0012FC87F2|nr:hypothetical protein [Pelomonas sp. Root1444]
MDPFQAFAIQRRADFRRIARQTEGEHTAEDVENQAWLIAASIAAKRGYAVNFSLRIDQELVLAWLHNELVKYADKQVRYAVKLDRDWDTDDAAERADSLAHLLAAPAITDPAVQLLQREEVSSFLVLARHSYSQAAAYGILLDRFNHDPTELATYLCIVTSTLYDRLRWCTAWIEWQSSLFDGIQVVPFDFEPTKARLLRPRLHSAEPVADAQLAWPFSFMLP